MNSRADYSDRRQIIVFVNPASESSEQIHRIVDAARCQLVDRDTDVRYVNISELPDAEVMSKNKNRDKHAVLAELVTLRGAVRYDFEIILIGKDGGVKARANDPNALKDFLSLIDTMPMRRAELRSRGGDDVCD